MLAGNVVSAFALKRRRPTYTTFLEADPLRRARMPHDARWRAYEYLRTGLMPEEDGAQLKGVTTTR